MKMDSSCNEQTMLVGDIDEKTFNIIANDKMFKILSSKIYTNKILAPIRELSTNAYDAHVEANKKEVPFEVHLPEYDNKNFWIRDFGYGMDGKQIEELYTTYGYSSKSNSNDFVGCLGLGSKSPFAYTDKFMITSIKNGVCYKYSCYLDDGVPKVCKFDEYETQDESGLKIEFPVNDSDFNSFLSEASNLYNWFDVYPKFVGSSVLTRTDEHKLTNGAYVLYHYGNALYSVLMGNILYPIKGKEWFEFCTSHGITLSTFFKSNYYCQFVFPAKIGDFDISVSRESLELTESNVLKFIQLVDNFYKKELSDALNEIGKQKNKIETYKKVDAIINQKQYLKHIVSDYANYIDYKDEDFESNEILYKGYAKGWYSSKKTCNFFEQKGGIANLTNYAKNFNFYVVLQDNLKGSNLYREFIKQNDEKNYLIITNNIKFFDWCKSVGMTERKKEDFIKYKAPRANVAEYFYTLSLTQKYERLKFNRVSSEVFEDDDIVYYVPIEKERIVIDEEDFCFEGLWWKLCQNFFNIRIVGLREKEFNKYKDDERFVNCIEKWKKATRFTKEEKEKVELCYVERGSGTLDEEIRKGLTFNTDLMNDEIKKEYEIYLKRVFLNKEKAITSFTENEKLYSKIIEKSYNPKFFSIKTSNSELMKYLKETYPLIERNVLNYWQVLEENVSKEVKNYVALKEKQLLNEREC